ncbi:xanthine dehydrogenase family protein molybdopterin-binding subunit [Sphingosinicella microcystinivorans]|uniref:xanthine dehydrogenase family protein molybdopterin-binding subunit n=1 Tax=Sphingosinicella microcystinivorans TaxID=335406 RepID=UPI0022F3C701|nr:xanthine dehydrogenase family protein molybdopterin-binding subunit [Sphingosinicella microcystinivorans]WBX85204.1 xanthine dehydrogenase family protein molybdopterin-binding subunit [Sphingosinicella microcystinivorans]
MSAVGQSVRRTALGRFAAGRGRYVGDIDLPGMATVAFARSPVAHAELLGVDVTAARAMPGVLAVITGEDVAGFAPQPSLWNLPGQNHSGLKALATDRLRYVGQAFAAVVAVDRRTAEAATRTIVPTYRALPVVADMDAALCSDAPRLYDHWPDNVVSRPCWQAGDIADAFDGAALVVSDRFTTQRVHPCSLEPRGVVVEPGLDGESITVWLSTQSIHQVRAGISECLGLPEHRIRVIAPDVGGSFGMKACIYGEEVVLAFLAQCIGRPLRWIETRAEAFVASTHGRDERVDLAVAFDADGRIRGLRSTIVLDKVADPYATSMGTAWITGAVMTGPYRIDTIDIEALAVVTNKTPTGAYRGFGQPEANFALERALDMAAPRLGLDPADLRRRNLVAPSEMPYPTPTGIVLDSGRYADLLDATLERFGYDEARQAQPSSRHRTGVGIACYAETTNFGPSPLCKLIGVDSGGFDVTSIRMEPSGHVRVFVGQTPMGQGVETALAQVAADELGLPVEDISIVHGDTVSSAYTAYASGGSRGAGVAGGSTALAARRLQARILRWGAHLLDAPQENVRFVQGGVEVTDMPTRRIGVAEIAAAAYKAFSTPEELEPGLEDRAAYDPPSLAIAYGCVVAEVAVDLDTGKVTVERVIFGHDCGVQINPAIVEGQVIGGLAQALGATLFEEMRYDAEARPLTLSLQDYLLPLASDVPHVELVHFETPTPFSPIGAKGVGESGTIAVPAAIANAVQNAIGPAMPLLTLPLTAERVLAVL